MTTLLAVSPILALILAAALIVGLRLLRPRFAHPWLIAVAGGLLALGLLFASAGSRLSLPLANWRPLILLPISPTLLLDDISWRFALAVVSLNLAFLLTNVIHRASSPERAGEPSPPTEPAGAPVVLAARWRGGQRFGRAIALRLAQKAPFRSLRPPETPPGEPPAASPGPERPAAPTGRAPLAFDAGRPGGSWSDLGRGLLICAAALLALQAGNLPTLLLFWTLLDGVEALIWLSKIRTRRESEALVIALAARLAGTGLAAWGGIAAYAAGQSLAFEQLSPQLGPVLLVAAGLRLNVLPLRPPLLTAPGVPGGLRSLLRLTPAAASLAILARTAAAPPAAEGAAALLVLAGLAALLGGLVWINAASVQEGLPYWLVGGCGLALAAAASGQPAAALAWGLAALLVGGLIGLAAVRPPALGRLALLAGGLGVSALPFTPAWPAARLYQSAPLWLLPIFLLSQGLLLAGLARHALRRVPAPAQAERWVWIIYPLGLALLPGAQIAAWLKPAGEQLPWLAEWPSWAASGLAGMAFLLAVGLSAWQNRRRAKKRRPASHPAASSPSAARQPAARQPLPGWLPRLRRALELDWLYRLGWQVYRLAGRVEGFVSAALEGQAGLLWALLALTLLLSLLVGRGQGGG